MNSAVQTQAVAAASADSTLRSTWRALLQPKRLVPILVVCVPMVLAQDNPREKLAVPLGLVMCSLFVLVAPVSWRLLNPEGRSGFDALLRLVTYALLGTSLVYTVGWVLPAVLRMKPTFLTVDASLVVCTALFCVGGWGLGRDIGLEEGLARERARAEGLAREAERAQLLALRSHLDPHFLFNTLNAIAEWCRTDGEVAERAVLQLSAMLREVLAGVRDPTWSLSRELEMMRTLFSLHLLRDPELFTLQIEVPDEVGVVPVPPMLLLPLAENAVKHGPAAGHRGVVHLRIEREGDSLRFTLENPGAYRGPRPGSSGLPVVEKRLMLAYGEGAKLEIRDVGERTRVELKLPMSGPLQGVTT